MEEKFNPELVKEWRVVQTKEGGFQFFPGLVEGEGLFFALLQKPFSNDAISTGFIPDKKSVRKIGVQNFQRDKVPNSNVSSKGRNIVQPDHDYALSANYAGEWPSVELSRQDALQYLSRNSLKLEDAPLGYLRVTYNGLGLGFVKNLGNRANNLYPMNWRIRMDIPGSN